MRGFVCWAAVVLVLAGCGTERSPTAESSPSETPSEPAGPSKTSEAEPVLMPDLTGLASNPASSRLVDLSQRERLDLGYTWARPVLVGCDVRPHTVVRQHPAPGTVLTPGTETVIRTAELDLKSERGPCRAEGGALGPVDGADAAIARAFYRFAADPTLGAPFAPEPIWVGIEGGHAAVHLDGARLRELAAWQIGEFYAERMGPFSALDVVAASGGWFELHRGIPGCAGTTDDVPPELSGLRAITLTGPADTIGACMDWWGVTLFLDDAGLIRGVALRLGSP